MRERETSKVNVVSLREGGCLSFRLMRSHDSNTVITYIISSRAHFTHNRPQDNMPSDPETERLIEFKAHIS